MHPDEDALHARRFSSETDASASCAQAGRRAAQVGVERNVDRNAPPPCRAHYRVTNSLLQRVDRGDFVASLPLLLSSFRPVFYISAGFVARAALATAK